MPRFAPTDHGRSAACALERRCSVCGLFVERGPVWRVVGAAESAATAGALAAGQPYRNLAPAMAGPGHRACMLYAAMVCPYLARPDARRRASAGEAADERASAAVRGAARGGTGAVVGFGDYEYAATETRVLFRFPDLVGFLPHESADEHLAELRARLAKTS